MSHPATSKNKNALHFYTVDYATKIEIALRIIGLTFAC